MSARWNFARRPFRDERPVFVVVGAALGIGLLLAAANFHLYWKFSRQVEGTRAQIAGLEARRVRASRSAEEAKAALNGYKLSSLAQESAALQTIVRERRFSWLALLARLEHTLPTDVRVARLSPRFDSPDSVTVEMAMLGHNQDSVVHTLAALAKEPAFTSIELRGEASPERGVPEGYTFQIGMKYLPAETR